MNTQTTTETKFAATTDANKVTTRGMTETHANFEAAKRAIEVMAGKAEKLGWTRRVAGRGFVAPPDAFSSLPAAPKAAPKVVKAVKK
jgi:ribosomal protein L18